MNRNIEITAVDATNGLTYIGQPLTGAPAEIIRLTNYIVVSTSALVSKNLLDPTNYQAKIRTAYNAASRINTRTDLRKDQAIGTHNFTIEEILR